jgi:hypothetical protein
MTELHIQSTRFLAAVKEAERKEDKETVSKYPDKLLCPENRVDRGT